MIPHSQRPQHHLYWVNDAQRLTYYSYLPGRLQPAGVPNIWSARRANPLLRHFLDAWGRPPDSHMGLPEVNSVRQIFSRVRKRNTHVALQELRQTGVTVFRHGAFKLLELLAEDIEVYRKGLTKNYIQLAQKLPRMESRYDELLLLGTEPDLYFWQPPEQRLEDPNKLLVCFTTRSATLNMPLAVAHAILSRLGCAILYIRNQPKLSIQHGIRNIGFQPSADLIRHLTRQHGFTRLYGLGTSFGGLQACLYGSYLNFQRIVNFSGLTGKLSSQEYYIWSTASHYDQKNILSILSNQDETDRKLLNEYRTHGFDTRFRFLDFADHGTFTGAYLLDCLDDILDWLFSG